MDLNDTQSQGDACRRLWAAVVLDALDEYIRYPIERKDFFVRKYISDGIESGMFVSEPSAKSSWYPEYHKGVALGEIKPVPSKSSLSDVDKARINELAISTGIEDATRWLWSSDGKEVIELAGIHYCDRTCEGLLEFVKNGVTTTIALTLESKQQP